MEEFIILSRVRMTQDAMKICLACSHGGHLTEMFELLDAFRNHEVFYITYKSERTADLDRAYLVENLYASPWSIPRSLLRIAHAVITERPRVVVSTGSEIAIPVFALAKMLGIRTIYVESCARVTSASGTGRIVYWMADRFFVQWKELLKLYGRKATYNGGLL